jgi:excisionase family DNA binding protein
VSRVDAVTVPQAAEILGVSKERIHALITEGRLRVVEVEPFPGGKRFWLLREDVKDFGSKRRKGRRLG